MKHFLIIFFSVFVSYFLVAQSGGLRIYNFLNLPSSARASSMGGSLISVRDGDLNLVYDNPALLDTIMDNHFTSSYVNWISDINLVNFAYAKKISKKRMLSVDIQAINHGNFINTTATGQILGEFSAGEYVLDINFAKQINKYWHFGMTWKLIYSQLYNYKSFGTAFDLGLHYKKNNFQYALVLNNFGTQITKSKYETNQKEPMPLNIQMAISRKVENAPFRFMILLNQLYKYDLTTNQSVSNSQTLNLNGSVNVTSKNESLFSIDKIFRHIVIGNEILISKNFILYAAFNYRKRQEMIVSPRKGFTGYSFGTQFKIKKIYFSCSVNQYFLSKSSIHFSLRLNFNEFKRR